MTLTFLTTFILPLTVSFLITLAITPLIIKLYRHYHWGQHLGARQRFKDTHSGAVPRGGGLAIGLALALTLALGSIFFPLPQLYSPASLTLYLAAAILVVLGVLDDIFDLSPLLRLGVNLLVAGLVIVTGTTINFVTNPFVDGGVWDFSALTWLPPLLTLIYLVALINITNWAKGVDGQMPGMVVIALIIIGLVSYNLVGDFNYICLLCFAVAGSFAGFLWWNFYPQKIMPGYGGGSLAGFFLAVFSILADAKVATLFMVLAIPIADALFTITRRLLAGKSIFLGDRGHLHHKLLDKMGWGRRRIAVFYWFTTALFGLGALILPTWGKIIAFFLVLILVFYFLIQVKLKTPKLTN